MKDDEAEALDVRSAPDEALPVQSFREAAPYLRRPFTPEAIKFKVQAVFSGASGCLVVAYIDARLVVERLNRVIPDGWTADYEMIDGTKLMWCHLYVGGLKRSDVGETPKGLSKDLVSDSFKRAAVHFGVGVSVYALPQIALFLNDAKGRIEKKKPGGKETVALTEHGHVKLREGYAAWLDRYGRARFGEPLDHGDVEGSTIDEDEVAPEEFVPEPAAALDDPEATALRDQIKAVYLQIREADPKAVPPHSYNAWLQGAQHSHVELEKLLAHLVKRHGEVTA